MPAKTSRAQQFDLFDRTIAQMKRRLGRVGNRGEMLTALRWGRDELDRTYAATPAKVLATVACRDGCDACCRVPVDVQAHEVFFAADHIQVHFTPEALAVTVEQLARHRERMGALPAGQRDASRQTCVLLQAGSCSIYAGRPQPCRSHHTDDAAACAAHLADPNVDISQAYVPALRARMFAVMLGVDEALESAGYDERSYDFGSALHEALTNSLCLARWLRRGVAFPDNCLSEPHLA